MSSRLQLLQQILRDRLELLDQDALAVGIHHVGLHHPVFQLLGLGLGHIDLFERIEQAQQFVVAAIAQCAQERRRQEFTAALLAVQVDVQQIGGVELHFDPRAAVRNDPEGMQQRPVRVDRLLEADARRTVQLAHNDPFGAVDDERSLLGDQGHFAHEHGFLAHLRLVLQAEGHMQRGRVRLAFLQAFESGMLGRRDLEFYEVQRAVPIVAFDGKYLLEHRLQTDGAPFVRRRLHLQKFLVRAGLDLDQIRQLDHVRQLSKIHPVNHRVTYRSRVETAKPKRRAHPGSAENTPGRPSHNRYGPT